MERKKRTKNYSPEEDKIILEYIKDHPENIQEAIKLSAKKLQRTVSSVSYRYYKQLRGTKKVFLLASKKRGYGNIKNIPIKKNALREQVKIKQEILDKILELIDQL